MNDSIDMRTSTKSEKKIKLAVVQATEHIRNKFKEIHDERKENDRLLDEQYKPITKKLKNLIDAKTSTHALASAPLHDNHAAIDQINTASSPTAHAIRRPKVRFRYNRVQRRSNLRKVNHQPYVEASDANNVHENLLDQRLLDADLAEIPSDDDDDDELMSTDGAKAAADVSNSKRQLEHSDDEESRARRRSKATKVDRKILTKKLNAPHPKALQINHVRQPRERGKSRRSEAELLQLPYYNPASLHQRIFAKPMRRQTRSISLSGLNANTTGRGMIDLTKKEFHNNSNNFVYWNDANELVSRLRLLVSSVSAGHTGHNNEILSIIEELREENIIE